MHVSGGKNFVKTQVRVKLAVWAYIAGMVALLFLAQNREKPLSLKEREIVSLEEEYGTHKPERPQIHFDLVFVLASLLVISFLALLNQALFDPHKRPYAYLFSVVGGYLALFYLASL